ncbi:MAG: hypothetical protein ACMXX5_00200 [Candidatus Woesearchaeota archaeon]
MKANQMALDLLVFYHAELRKLYSEGGLSRYPPHIKHYNFCTVWSDLMDLQLRKNSVPSRIIVVNTTAPRLTHEGGWAYRNFHRSVLVDNQVYDASSSEPVPVHIADYPDFFAEDVIFLYYLSEQRPFLVKEKSKLFYRN